MRSSYFKRLIALFYPKITMRYLVQSIEISLGCGMILKARRFNIKVRQDDASVAKVPSPAVILGNFNGRKLLSKIYSCHNSLTVEQYQFPTYNVSTAASLDMCNISNKTRCYKW